MKQTQWCAVQFARRTARQPDPIMQALWVVKAQINKDCDYSIDKVFEMARASRLARLGQIKTAQASA